MDRVSNPIQRLTQAEAELNHSKETAMAPAAMLVSNDCSQSIELALKYDMLISTLARVHNYRAADISLSFLSDQLTGGGNAVA
jgi:hypothetical protein